MADTDPAAVLHDLAAWYRSIAANRDLSGSEQYEAAALAEHVEGVAQRHEQVGECCDWCIAPDPWPWPCPDVAELLAVAAAAGVTP